MGGGLRFGLVLQAADPRGRARALTRSTTSTSAPEPAEGYFRDRREAPPTSSSDGESDGVRHAAGHDDYGRVVSRVTPALCSGESMTEGARDDAREAIVSDSEGNDIVLSHVKTALEPASRQGDASMSRQVVEDSASSWRNSCRAI